MEKMRKNMQLTRSLLQAMALTVCHTSGITD
jgi:ribosomal protein L32